MRRSRNLRLPRNIFNIISQIPYSENAAGVDAETVQAWLEELDHTGAASLRN